MRVWIRSLLVAAMVLGGGCNTQIGGPIEDGFQAVDLHISTHDLAGAGCGLRTCASAHASCGPIGDGCGGVLQCGTCTAPKSCGGGGTPSVCGGSAGCEATTCQAQGFNCGPAGDGCGNIIQCGTCPAGQTCGTGGKPNVCAASGGGCTAKTCAQLGFNCGPAGDGCGGQLNCGTCGAGQSCGTGGKPGQCGPSNSCTPGTCAKNGFNCGMSGDGCGGTISCGTCTMPDICGGGGMPNVCGHITPPDMSVAVNCPGGMTTITGTVYAPTNPAAGYGQPDPIYNALVYIAGTAVTPFPSGVSCQTCSAQASGSPIVSATTGPDGKFTLTDTPCGANMKLVIQVGKWRRVVTIPSVKAGQVNQLTADQTRLPRNHTEGDIPLIAVVTGSADPIECVLPKIGIDASEYTLPNGTGRVRFYTSNGAVVGLFNPGAGQLYGSATELAKYDAVIADCEGEEALKSSGQRQNVLNYLNSGGRLFASHYSYTWLFQTAPLSSSAAWDVNSGTWDPPDVTSLTGVIDQSFKKGMDFATWLKNVGASTTLGQIPVQQVRWDADSVINPPAQQWMSTTPHDPASKPATIPIEFTFNTPVNVPAAQQCGRVLFSDFHVNTGGAATGLFPGECGNAAPMTPQEKVLEFMLFDLTSCIQPDKPPPATCNPLTCAQQGFTCGPAGDGCGNIIQCGTCPAGQTCGAGGPNKCGGCVPLTCAQQGFTCGPAGDGCGNVIQCGNCTPPQTCGGGGLPGVCGSGSMCTPRTCGMMNCGMTGDGCGGTINCGTCTPPLTCGGGGMPGICGQGSCVPQTCAGQKPPANCGIIGDGCGGTVDCGKCTAPNTCGGGGMANICGNLG